MINWSLLPPWFSIAFFATLGGIVGSFINAAIHRLPRNISMLTRSRSFCPRCEATIHWYDNIPILSFLALGGRCRVCGVPIPARYLTVELLCAALYALTAYQYFVLNAPASPGAAFGMPWIVMAVQLLLIADLLCITFTDLETWYIPVQTTWPFILLGLLLAPCFTDLHPARTEWLSEAVGVGVGSAAHWNALIDSVQGLIWGAGVPWLVGFACLVYLKKEGMGAGDSHLLGMMGAMLGWKAAMTTFILGTFIGLFLGLGSMAWGRYQRARLGEQWKPRQPTFELGEADLTPPPAWPLLLYGLLVLLFESGLIAMHFVQERMEYSMLEDLPFSAILGVLLGLCLLLAFIMHRHWLGENAWPQGERTQREDGTVEETLQGNYIPFGPSLALAGVIVLFYDPLLRAWAAWWLWQIPVDLPYRLPGAGG
jgi:leader peptidase (prepilin peptidase)/N-methyltransferase